MMYGTLCSDRRGWWRFGESLT